MDIRGGNFSRQSFEIWQRAQAERTSPKTSRTEGMIPFMGPSTGKSLLDLPAELREQIYSYVVIKEKTTITMLFDFNCYVNEVSAHQPAITQVCRQVRNETLPMFYTTNLFSAQLDQIDDVLTAKRWLHAIGNDNIRNLKRLCLCGWTKISIYHMISRRFLRVELSLWDGSLGFENEDEGHPHVVKIVERLKQSFKDMVEARRGEPFDIESLSILMEGFSALCAAC